MLIFAFWVLDGVLKQELLAWVCSKKFFYDSVPRVLMKRLTGRQSVNESVSLLYVVTGQRQCDHSRIKLNAPKQKFSLVLG